MRKPNHSEWDTTRLPEDRRAYLDAGLSFEEIAARILTEAEIVDALIEGYRDPPRDEKDARQVVFRIRASKVACDLFYNAPGGIRARYWQSPDHGLLATRYLIGILSCKLISFFETHPPVPPKNVAAMSSIDVRASLTAPSAKIWPRERDKSFFLVEQKLLVPRWVENEKMEIDKGWRRTSIGSGEFEDQIEIKGALLKLDGIECVPSSKLNRSFQIHRSGYT